MKKLLALFVEGETDYEFYRSLVAHIRKIHGTSFDYNIEYRNMRGVGNYTKDSIRRLTEIKKKFPDHEIIVFLCLDNDVFEFGKRPPININTITDDLKRIGAKKVIPIKAKSTIEDWFLLDFEGVLNYLRLPKNTPRDKAPGLTTLQKLFKKKNRLYVKGDKVDGFITHLDIGKILSAICKDINPLCKHMGLDCQKICSKGNP